MKKDDVISHLQIMHTWASFAHERGKLLGLPEICSIEEWTADALAMLKEQKAEILQLEAELDILRNIYKQENPYRQVVKWE